MFSLKPPKGSKRLTLAAAVLAAVLLSGIEFNAPSIPFFGLGSSGFESVFHTAADKTVNSAVKKKVSVKPAAKPLLEVVDQSDILPKHRQIADRVLRALPGKCRDSLQSFYVTYDKSGSRGLGGESVIILSGNVPDAEFAALLVHECGHVVDIGGIRGSLDSGRTGFYDGNTPIFGNDLILAFYQISWITPSIIHPGSTEKDFVSGYAMSDPFEDFAETFAYFALQQKEFKRIAEKNPALKAKYDFMANYVFNAGYSVAVGKHVRGKSAPWDVTKLPYVWIAKI